jgi:hypothetical protein
MDSRIDETRLIQIRWFIRCLGGNVTREGGHDEVDGRHMADRRLIHALQSALTAAVATAASMRQPLFAPSVRPETNCFCSAKNTINVGRATMTDPAASRL